MAAYDNDTQSLQLVTVGSTSFSHTSTGSNLGFLIFVPLTGNSQTVSSASLGGVSASFLAALNGTGNTRPGRLEVWGGVGQPTGAQTCSVVLSASNSAWDASVVSMTSVHQTTPFGAPVTGKIEQPTAQSTITLSVPSAVSDLIVDGTCSTSDNGTTSSGTQIWLDNSGATNTKGAWTAGSAGSVNVSETWDANPQDVFIMIAVNVKQFVAGGGNPPIARRVFDLP